MTKQKIIKSKKINPALFSKEKWCWVKAFVKKLPKKLAEKAFLTFLGLFVLSLIFGIFIFYKYSINQKTESIEDGKIELKFKLETYQKILQVWQNNEEQFEKIDSKQYFNLFIR
jgi:ABC-type maltose transport system permease subunit